MEGRPVSSNLVLFARPKHLELEPPAIAIKAAKAGDKCFELTLEAQRPALWTWIEVADAEARFSDNFVHLKPGEPAKITVQLDRDMKTPEFKRRLRASSLIDTYNA